MQIPEKDPGDRSRNRTGILDRVQCRQVREQVREGFGKDPSLLFSSASRRGGGG